MNGCSSCETKTNSEQPMAQALFWLGGSPWEMEFAWYLGKCFGIKIFFLDKEGIMIDIPRSSSSMQKRIYSDYPTFLRDNDTEFETVAVETYKGGTSLKDFKHPSKALYLFGGEYHGLETAMCSQADHQIRLDGKEPYNASMAAGLVLYHRFHLGRAS